MIEPKKDIHSHSIVLLGDFNPKIFHPSWFALNGLITSGEAAEAAEDGIKILHSDLCVLKLNWATIEVTRDRFKVSSSNQAFFEPILDLVLGTFSILEHTPLRMMGINNEIHYSLRSDSDWGDFYGRITPAKFWDDVLESSKLETIVVKQKRKIGPNGYIKVKIEESVRIKGVYFEINNHFEINDPEKVSSVGAAEIMNILKEYWTQCNLDTTRIINDIWSK